MGNGVKNYSKDNEYYTPKEIVSRFGSFDYDPATTREKAEEFEFLTTKKFHETAEGGGLVYLPNGRIKFESGLGKDTRSPAFGSVVIKIQDEWGLKTMKL